MTGRRVNLYLNMLVLVLFFSIPVYRKWAVMAAPLLTLLWFFEGRMRARLHALGRHPLTLAVLAFIGLHLLSLLWSSEVGAAFDYVSKFHYLLLVPVIATSLRARFHSLALMALAAGTAVSLALEYAVFIGLFRFREAYAGNPSPTMSHLDYSIVLAVAALVMLNHAVVDATGWKQRVIWGTLCLLTTGGLLINIGRSGQVAFAGALLVMAPLYLSRRSPRTVAAAVAAVALGLVVTFLLVPGLHLRIDSAASDLRQALVEHRYQDNLGKRIAGIIVGLDIVAEHPVLGVGPGDNMAEFRRLLDTRYPELKTAVYWFPHLHNQYLQTATEVGLIGLVALMALFGCLLWGPYPDREDRTIAVLLTVVYLLGFFGDPFLHKQLPLTLLAALAGLVSARGRSLFWRAERVSQE